jgi:Electron transfer DM13
MLAITEELGRFEEYFSDVVYPVWPLWLAAAIVVAAVALFFAYRLGWHEWALQHRFVSGGVLAIVLAVGVPTGWYTISPLFDRETVCEASPIAGAGAGSEKCAGLAVAVGGGAGTATPTGRIGTAGAATPQASPEVTSIPALEPSIAAEGQFQGADDFHFGRGKALLIETSPGAYALRFEEFSVRNGPDLFVYLSPSASGYADGALELGELKGTDGAFNYDVPPGTDVSQFQSAIVWCKAFSVLFATAMFTEG